MPAVTVVAETIVAGTVEAAGCVAIGGTAAGAKTLPPMPKVDGRAAGMLLTAVAEAIATGSVGGVVAARVCTEGVAESGMAGTAEARSSTAAGAKTFLFMPPRAVGAAAVP